MAGVVLFLIAPSVARSILFHYSFGALLSILLLVVFIVRRPKSVGVTVAGVASLILSRGATLLGLPPIVLDTPTLALLAACVALFGVIVVYVWDPMSNPRLVNVVQWALQAGALCAVMASVTLWPVGVALAAALLLIHLLAHALCSCGCGPCGLCGGRKRRCVRRLPARPGPRVG